jgi:hypothetical protein
MPLGLVTLSLRSEIYQNSESIKHTLLTNMTLRMSSCAVPLHKQAKQNPVDLVMFIWFRMNRLPHRNRGFGSLKIEIQVIYQLISS